MRYIIGLLAFGVLVFVFWSGLEFTKKREKSAKPLLDDVEPKK